MRARLGFFMALSLGGRPADAQTGPLVRWPEAVGFVVVTGVVFATDGGIRATIQGHGTRFRNTIAEFGNGFGNPRYVLPGLVVATVSAYATGSDLSNGSRRALKSVSLATVTTLVLKSLVGRQRPEVSPEDPYRFSPLSIRNNSFPSGHTAVAFSLATSLAMETKSDLVGVVLYTLAASTAFARLHIDKHWASDTLGGAAIGILAARYVRRHDGGTESGMPLFALSFTF